MMKISFAGLLTLCAILLLHFLPFAPVVNYTVTFVSSSALFLFLAFVVFRNDVQQKTVFILIAAALVVRLSFMDNESPSKTILMIFFSLK